MLDDISPLKSVNRAAFQEVGFGRWVLVGSDVCSDGSGHLGLLKDIMLMFLRQEVLMR